MTKSPLTGMQYFDCVSTSGTVSVLDRIPVRCKCRNFIAFNIRIKILFNVLFSSCNGPVFLRVFLHVIVRHQTAQAVP